MLPPLSRPALLRARRSCCRRRRVARTSSCLLRANRGWSEDEWAATVEVLRSKGWIDASGAVTDAGRATRDRLEDTTDRLAAPIIAGIGSESAGELVALLRPLADVVMASGTVSAVNNMGLPWPPITDSKGDV